MYMDLALSPLPCEWRCGPWRRWSCGGLVTRLLGIETPSALPGWAPGMGWAGRGTSRSQRGQVCPHPGRSHPSRTGPRCSALQTYTQVLAEAGQLRRPASSPSCMGQDSPIPYPYPHPGCPADGHDRPTWNVYHVILELSGEKCVPRLQASRLRQSLGVPRGLATPRANPSPSLAGGWRREGPVPSGARSRRIRSVFSTQPGTTSFRPRRPDPRFGSGSGIRSGPAPEAGQRPGGYACGSSPRRRAGWLRRLLRPGVDYNGSLCRKETRGALPTEVHVPRGQPLRTRPGLAVRAKPRRQLGLEAGLRAPPPG